MDKSHETCRNRHETTLSRGEERKKNKKTEANLKSSISLPETNIGPYRCIPFFFELAFTPFFRSLEIIPQGKRLSKNSELGSHGYPMRVNGILDHLVVKVRATFSRAHVATAANRVLLLAKRSISGCGRVAEVLPLQEHGDLPERWPLALLPPPTVEHQIVNILGARGRLR